MSLPRYPEYKDSGVAWLGEVPSHWVKHALQDTAQSGRNAFVDGPFGSDLKSEEYADEGIPLIQLNNVSVGKHDLTNLKFIPEKKAEELARHKALPGDIVIAKMAAPVARAAIVSSEFEKFVIVADCVKLSVDSSLWNTNFLQYWINCAEVNALAETLSAGITRLRINLGSLKKLPVFHISLSEQIAIATFLDRETDKIDALIAEQEKLLTLLAEKRQATISHAVTKGLNPDAPMKDSGVAWLGEVPAHWVIRSLKNIVSTPITDGPHETPVFGDEGVPFVSAEAVSGGYINFDKIRGHITREEHERFSLKYTPKLHDIYMVKSGATTGVTAIVETEREFNIWSPLAAIRCNAEIANPYYVLNYLRSRNFQEAVALNWSFGTQQNIGMGVLGDLQVALPPLEEQLLIGGLLTEQATELDALILEATRAIELLKERRTALISAAVTGKIDVRALA